MSGWIKRSLCLLALLLLSGCADRGIVREGGRVTVAPGPPVTEGFTIERDDLNDVLARGPSWLIQQVTVRPVLMDRRFYGFQLVELFPESPELQNLPIKVGDIVQQANGISIERPDQFMKAWQSLGSADYLSLRVIRDGRPMQITWLVTEGSQVSPPPAVSAR